MNSEMGVIGSPIGHSVSPAFQQAALDQAGIDATYLAYDVQAEELNVFMQGLREPGVLGINITTPHKGAVIPFLDEMGRLGDRRRRGQHHRVTERTANRT